MAISAGEGVVLGIGGAVLLGGMLYLAKALAEPPKTAALPPPTPFPTQTQPAKTGGGGVGGAISSVWNQLGGTAGVVKLVELARG
jgi:hypothetical protein